MSLKEVDAFLAEGDGDLDSILLQYELIGRREKVINDLQPSERLICVLLNVLHTVSCLFARNRRR